MAGREQWGLAASKPCSGDMRYAIWAEAVRTYQGECLVTRAAYEVAVAGGGRHAHRRRGSPEHRTRTRGLNSPTCEVCELQVGANCSRAHTPQCCDRGTARDASAKRRKEEEEEDGGTALEAVGPSATPVCELIN